MRIPNKVVCLWSCLTAFTFIHTAVAQDYPVDPLTAAGDAGGVTRADYIGNADLSSPGVATYGQDYSPLAYEDGSGSEGDEPAVAVPLVPAVPPPVSVEGYPSPVVDPYTNYWPQVSPFDEPVMDRTYRQNGIWVNDSMYGHREYLFSLEYLRVGFNRPGTDTIGARGIVPADDFNPALYDVVNASVFGNGNDLTSDGLRAKFIMANADSSSLEFGGFWVAEGLQTFQPLPPANPNNVDTLRARGFLGLDDGTEEGVEVAFDTDYKLTYKTQAFGAEILYATIPLYETTGFKLRPTYGLKYFKVREQFTLHGEDSNLNYVQNGTDGAPIPGTVQPNPFGNPPFASDLTSRVVSDLVGPELGLRYEVGGRNFLLSGQSRFALAVNHENIDLFGNQIGEGFETGFPTPTPANPKPAAFRDGQSHTHVSPIFSQDFYFKGKVFRHIPILNDLPPLADANVLLGYNFLLAGEMARPTKIIDWRVDNPRIDLSRSRWYMQSLTFGLEWQF